MDDFLNFRKLVTPSIIKVLFWISSILCVVAGIILIASSFGAYGSGAPTFLIGLCIALLGPIFSRIICETLFVIFQTHEKIPTLKPAKKPQNSRGNPKNK
jgi:hypothetical protein